MNISKRSLLILSMFLLILPNCGKQEEAKKEKIRPVRAMQLATQKSFSGRWWPGQAKAGKEANLSFRVSGTIQTLPVKIGDKVKKGDLLASLDSHDYQVELNDAKAKLGKAVAQSKLAETDYNRVAGVYKKDPGAVSKSLVDQRKAGLESSKASVESAKANVEKAKDNFGYTSLKAPFDGVVAAKFIENFEKVQPMKQVLRVVNTQEIEFIIHIPERLMQYADKTAKGHVVYDAKPDVQVPVSIKEIGREASKTTRTYPITLVMKQPKEFTILPGMAGKARAKGDRPRLSSNKSSIGGIKIPMSSLVASKGEGSHVWVIDEKNKQVKKRTVKVLNVTGDGALVTGLNPEEWIATAGANTLVEDQKVRILQ